MTMMEEKDVGEVLSGNMLEMFSGVSRILEDRPDLLPVAMDVVDYQREAYLRRRSFEERGVHVPPFMILSVTNRCNLNCVGCYAKKLQDQKGAEMDDGTMNRILGEARDLGISVILTAGGEPLIRKGLLDTISRYPEIVFPLFTNGTMLSETMVRRIKEMKNVVPVLSIEGERDLTDRRRGEGIYETIRRGSMLLKDSSVFWGVSVTVTRENFHTVTSEEFIENLCGRGCHLFFFVEYIPVSEGTEDLEPTMEQRKELLELSGEMKERFPGIFICFPGDEEEFGGCLSSGRGFVHINPQGELEPCPFAPYSDTDLKRIPLEKALGSRLLAMIRENHDKIEETSGGCALWKNREWVRSLMR
mgnify:CR=1 FL=1